jgi:signal transduction histidine kinase
MGHLAWHRRVLLVMTALAAFATVTATLLVSVQWIQKPFPGFFLHDNLTVGPYFLPHWSGASAGLKSLDLVLSINDAEVRERSRVYQLVHESPPGTPFRYKVARGSEIFELRVPSLIFLPQDWLLSFGVYIFTGLAFFMIGIAPYYFGAASPAALPLCFMVMAVFVWFETTFDFMTLGVLPKEVRLFSMILTPSAGIHLAYLFKTGKALRRFHPYVLVLSYSMAAILGGLNSFLFFGPISRWADIFRLNYAYALFGAAAFLWIVGTALRGNLPELERSRLRVVFVGAVLGFFIPTFLTVLTTSFRLSIPYNIALVPTLFFPLSIAYALLKYSLFDLGNVIKMGLSRLSLMIFLLALYAGTLFLVGPSVGIYSKDPLTPILFSVLVVVVFNPLLRRIETSVDRYIYKQEYDPAEVHAELSLFLRSLAGASDLAEGFLRRSAERLRISGAALVYRPQTTAEYLIAKTDQTDGELAIAADLACGLWGHRFGAGCRGMFRQEVITNPIFRGERDQWLAVFDRLRSELLIPIVFHRQVRGLVSYGPKIVGKEYSATDLRLLERLAEQLALSLENGVQYEQSEKSKDEYKRLYGEAEAAKKRLIDEDRVKKDFVANVCHELRTPLSTIIGYGEILLDDKNLGGRTREMLERMVNNGQDLSGLMDGLLNFSRMKGDSVPNRLEHVNVRDVVAGVGIMTQRLIRGRPIQFRLNIESAVETIQSDPRKLQEILVQLLTNALKFTERGEVELKLRSGFDGENDFLEIAVADTGIGIDKRDQELIFEGFRQLERSSTRRYGGTGVGLSLCRQLAEALGGKITVRSEIGAGSVFSFILPLPRPLMN